MVAQQAPPQVLEYQVAELQRLEQKVNAYEHKLAAMKEMTNVFLVALISFYAVWIYALVYEVMEWPIATWTALSIACTFAIGLLMAYMWAFASVDRQAKADLYQRRMSLGVVPQQEALPAMAPFPPPAPPPPPSKYAGLMEQLQAAQPERERDAHGRFAPKVAREKL
jgi:hypothetical protein